MKTQMNADLQDFINHKDFHPVRGVVSNGAGIQRGKYFFNLGGFVP